MKKTDIAMIILIASLSMAVAYFVAGAIPGLKEAGTPETVKQMISITPKEDELDEDVFKRGESLNPTVPVTIGTGQTQTATP